MSEGLEPPLVSVVVPLFNGAPTIERTLDSIVQQTWPNLEIVVVDDGSTDEGPERVRAYARRCGRPLRLVHQANAGVAAARNHGAAAAMGDHLAFIDADDLWSPEKLELQMARLAQMGPDAGLVYTWAALIDEHDRVYSLEHRPSAEGDIFRALCRSNVVGNGSSPLILRTAFEAVGGYDSSLRGRGAQGCEDLMIYLRIAERYQVGLVRRHVTGYRVTRDNMSSNALRMLQSCELTLASFSPKYPEYAAEFEAHRRDMVFWLLARAVTTGPLKNVPVLLATVRDDDAVALLRRVPHLAWLTLRARTPAPIKAAVQRLARRGGAFRPSYLEATL